MIENAKVFTNCRHFRGDCPCAPHKREGVHCEGCGFHDPVKERILFIKLAADGDVLRTTCLLPALKEAYPHAHITWTTESSAEPLLRNHPLIDRVWTPPERFLSALMVEVFDLVINTDTDKRSCWLAELAKSKMKRGFVAGTRGEVVPLSAAAEGWFQMGLWDDLKRANRRSYSQIIYGIAGLDGPVCGPGLFLTDEEMAQAKGYLVGCGWRPEENNPVIGVNTGAGRRWPRKAFPVETLEKVIEELLGNRPPPVDVFLLGGPEERERNSYLAGRFTGRIVDTRTDNPLRRFAGIVAHTNVLLTGDTLAMHIGIALDKYTVAHFGPTSPWEIDLRGNGERIVPDLECIGCYLNDCDRSPACNELLSPQQIMTAVRRGLLVCGKVDH